jgi:hypothetical protein
VHSPPEPCPDKRSAVHGTGATPAEQWVGTEEFWDQATAAEVLPFLGEVTAMARRARQAGERLYCWSSL